MPKVMSKNILYTIVIKAKVTHEQKEMQLERVRELNNKLRK